MKTYTEAQGRAAIEVAKSIAAGAGQNALIQLFAIAQLFYRQPVGDEAVNAMQWLIPMIPVDEVTAAIFYISGASSPGNSELWARLVHFEV